MPRTEAYNNRRVICNEKTYAIGCYETGRVDATRHDQANNEFGKNTQHTTKEES